MRLSLVAAGIALAVPFGAQSASAAPTGAVLLDYEYRAIPLDVGHRVVVECVATADPGKFDDIPVATAVTCRLGDMEPQSRALPGHQSVVVVEGTFLAPPTLCISGEAGFIDVTNADAYVATNSGSCPVIPL